jgi:hypothetical protein
MGAVKDMVKSMVSHLQGVTIEVRQPLESSLQGMTVKFPKTHEGENDVTDSALVSEESEARDSE